MTNWSRFESHQTVQAAKIVNLVAKADGAGRNRITEIMVKADPHAVPEPFVPNVPGALERAEIGGWALISDDGTKDVQRQVPFERDFRIVEALSSPAPPKASEPVVPPPLPAPVLPSVTPKPELPVLTTGTLSPAPSKLVT